MVAESPSGLLLRVAASTRSSSQGSGSILTTGLLFRPCKMMILLSQGLHRGQVHSSTKSASQQKTKTCGQQSPSWVLIWSRASSASSSVSTFVFIINIVAIPITIVIIVINIIIALQVKAPNRVLKSTKSGQTQTPVFQTANLAKITSNVKKKFERGLIRG